MYELSEAVCHLKQRDNNKTIEYRTIGEFLSFITEILRFTSLFLSFYLLILISRKFANIWSTRLSKTK